MGSGESPSLSIVHQVAAHEGVDPSELEPPLHEVIDPDALDALVQSTARQPSGSAATIEFTYRHRRIRVDSTGNIDVTATNQLAESRLDSGDNSPND
ncbi:HalOD1 output domain-containing protein [Halopiger djelfimassiliensis]|uniref:HalOD1 output domain-containing protein n=1 Tax=Halopiger djelfimassiliensis TaxID=1293047 RepID=UPI000677D621|nr:HalOD1 output domain-containing protein [Halopiger djelfimassiliensis]